MFCHALTQRNEARRRRERREEPNNTERNDWLRPSNEHRKDNDQRETARRDCRKRIRDARDSMYGMHDRLAERPGEQSHVTPDHDGLCFRVQHRG